MLTLNSALFYILFDLYQLLHKNDSHLSTYIQQMKGKIISLHPHFSHASRGQEAMQLSGNMICTIKRDQLLSYWQLFHLFIRLVKMLCIVLFLFSLIGYCYAGSPQYTQKSAFVKVIPMSPNLRLLRLLSFSCSVLLLALYVVSINQPYGHIRPTALTEHKLHPPAVRTFCLQGLRIV